MSCTRPESIPFPSVWHRFQAKAPDSDAEVTYVVQDLPEDRFEDGVAFMSRFFPHDEQMNQVLGLASDSVAMTGVVQLWREMLKLKLSVVCFREGSPEIVGLNVLGVASKEDRVDEKVTTGYCNYISIPCLRTVSIPVRERHLPDDLRHHRIRIAAG